MQAVEALSLSFNTHEEFSMPLSERLAEHVRACFSGIYIETYEHDEALREVAELCRQQEWRFATWDIARGLKVSGGESVSNISGDPLAAIRAAGTLANGETPTLLVLVNFHHYLRSPEVVQSVSQAVTSGKQTRTILVVLASVVELPPELERQFVVLEHPLPSREQIDEIAQGVATESGELPDGDAREQVLDAAVGLTRQEAENAFSLAIVRHSTIEPRTVWELKAQTLKKSGLLSLYRGTETFTNLGGLDALKAFCKRLLRKPEVEQAELRPKGIMLLSPPGCGKSQFVKCLGAETGRPTLMLDVGSLYGSLVGQTEARVRQAIQQLEAMAPCVALIDEVEKALGGATGGGNGDSGVSSRLFSTLLTWLNDRTSDVFVCCTANDISKLPPEFARSERFDGIWYVDLPNRQQKDDIWSMYTRMFRLDDSQPQPVDDQWSGAEIRSCCRLSALLGVSLIAAAEHVVPVAQTASEGIEKLRSWANGRCLSADTGSVYSYRSDNKGSSKRTVMRPEPSDN
jgi:hypothetical protein